MIEIWTDGSCSGNPGKGGWAFFIKNTDIYSDSGFDPDTTNNRMEMTACIKALEYLNLEFPTDITIYSDSQYVINGITNWIKGWKKNNWKNGKVKNQDLWTRLDSLNKSWVKWQWVKGHTGDLMNEKVNELAQSRTFNRIIWDD